MHVIVVGAGIVGVCTAYWLNRHGLEVTVIDRRSGVAQESSFGSAGIMAPDYASPWAAPGMPRHVFKHLFRAESPVLLRPRLDPAMWRFIVRWLGQCRAERFVANKLAMRRVGAYSREQFTLLRDTHGFEYERHAGYLQLLRTQRDLDMTKAARQVLADNNVLHKLLSAEEAAAMAPHLQDAMVIGTPLAGAIHYPNDESGNCPLYARLMAAECARQGVKFLFHASARLQQGSGGIHGVAWDDGQLQADAVVVAAGSVSAEMLARVGISIPMYPVRGYAANVYLRHDAVEPREAFIDEAYRVNVTPLNQRVRIAGIAELGTRGNAPGQRDKAQHTLVKVAQEWLPGMLDFSRATWWTGAWPMTPDGPPILGATRLPGLFLNIGHGSQGWNMAAGAGRIVADLVAGKEAEIDLSGLGIDRYSRA